MALMRSGTGLYSTNCVEECVDLFCGVLFPAAAIRGFRRRGGKTRELEFHRGQCLEIINEAEVLSSVKEELKDAVEKSYRDALSLMRCDYGM
ncbi:MAG: hypothetical protein ACP5E4_02550 [Candidatus Aenigmatarchaeota archaeon]